MEIVLGPKYPQRCAACGSKKKPARCKPQIMYLEEKNKNVYNTLGYLCVTCFKKNKEVKCNNAVEICTPGEQKLRTPPVLL